MERSWHKKQGIMGEILCKIKNELEEASKEQTSQAVHLPPPLKQWYVPPIQNATVYTVNHCPNYSFSATPEAPISSNRLAIPHPTGTITDSSILTQYLGT